jgi:UDP-N-acetylglucosamine 3-dehydrogenase
MSRPLSCLLVGAGTMGVEHGAALAGLPGASVAGFVSRNPANARKLAARFGGRTYATLREGLRAARPDVVFILTPTPTHRRLVERAAAAGAAVFCEKPLAPSQRDAEALLHAVRRAKVPFMTGHVLRWFPEFRKLRELIRCGSLGSPGVARLSRGGPWPRGSGDWYTRASGGPLLDLVIHDFDWLRWTFGPVVRVFARASQPTPHRPQAATLTLLRHASGPIAHVEGTWGHDLPFRVTAEVAGSRAVADYDSLHPPVLAVHAPARRNGRPKVAVPESPLAESPYRAQDRHFLDCVRTGADPDVSPDDALQALRISLAAIQSLRTGRPERP